LTTNKVDSLRFGIRDNFLRGTVIEFSFENIQPSSKCSIVSSYFTSYTCKVLKDKLGKIDNLQFLFGEPCFVKSLDPKKTDKKAYKIEDEELKLTNHLAQSKAARECEEWITNNVEIKSIRKANLLTGKMYHI
jgi:hypothetical protein